MTCGGLQIAKPVKKNVIVTLKSILEFIYCLLAALYMRISSSSAQPRLDLIKKTICGPAPLNQHCLLFCFLLLNLNGLVYFFIFHKM